MTFSKDLEQFTLRAGEATERTSRGTTLALWRAVILDSPVDKGRFRNNWFASSGAPSNKTTEVLDKSGASAVSRAVEVVTQSPNWTNQWLSNNLPYGEVLEFGLYPSPSKTGTKTSGGFSTQAIGGMVRVNVARFQSIINEEAKQNKI